MKSNDAITALTNGLNDGGIDSVYNFPGFHSHVIFNELGGKQISINERVAFETAYGASLAGKRSVVTCKGAGLNAAADVFLHMVLNGLNAGLVLVLSDDVEAQGSPERQDSRPFKDIFGGLWLEPTNLEQAYTFGKNAFRWSEQMDVPVVIRLTNQFFALSGEYKKFTKTHYQGRLKHERGKYVSYWKIRNDHLKEKRNVIRHFVEKFYRNQPILHTSETGIICIGNCQRELKNYKQKKADLLSICTYPLPNDLIKQFVQNRKEIIILEQGNDYVANRIRGLVRDISIISDTGDEPDRSKDWVTWNTYETMFKALKNTKPSFVVGDEGSFTDETTKSIEVCLCMGASIGVTMGMAANGVNYPFCVIGDTSFQFAGKQTLEEAVHRNIHFGIILLDNGGAQTTGGQKKIGNIYNLSGAEKVIVKYEETSIDDFEDIFKKMKTSKKLSILYVQM